MFYNESNYCEKCAFKSSFFLMMFEIRNGVGIHRHEQEASVKRHLSGKGAFIRKRLVVYAVAVVSLGQREVSIESSCLALGSGFSLILAGGPRGSG